MFTRMTLGAEGEMANADHLIGALVITVVVIALAETGRAVRFALIPLGAALFITPFVYGVDGISIASSFICAALLIALSLPKGKCTIDMGCGTKRSFNAIFNPLFNPRSAR
ncbi:hypothetical protein P4S73_13945 [Paraglaciecola sp. Hal342]